MMGVLIYYVMVNNLCKGQCNVVVGLLMIVVQVISMIVGFWLMYVIMGLCSLFIWGDFIVYIMIGIFMFMMYM